MKLILKLAMYLLILIVVILGGLILFATATRYQPPPEIALLTNDNPPAISTTTPISLLSWNLGYAGLGDDMDFFYDGGKNTRTSQQRTLENHTAIISFLESNQADFLLLQEVDKRARRSYYVNTPDSLKDIFPYHEHSYGKNYKVRFVPVPFTSPMGYVNSGIMTISKPWASLSKRVSFPGQYPWPDRLFNLERCFLLNRYPTQDGRELVVINTHNSAFDDGSLRRLQMDFLKDFLLQEYEKGNYVIAGGDWNQCPPGFQPQFTNNLFDNIDLMYIPGDFLPDWQWVFDPKVPTNRRLQTPYFAETTLTTVIDYFLISPNVELVEVRGIHLDFKHSDHNPVFARVILKAEKP